VVALLYRLAYSLTVDFALFVTSRRGRGDAEYLRDQVRMRFRVADFQTRYRTAKFSSNELSIVRQRCVTTVV
jgi:hypothetical protein